MPLDWNSVMRRYQENPETETINRKKVTIGRVTASSVYIKLPSGEQSVSRKNLERAVEKIEEGLRISSPTDYRRDVADERPAYAWAILHDLGYLP